MLHLPSPILAVLRTIIGFFTRGKFVPENPINEFDLDLSQPIIYVIPSNSLADVLTLQLACKQLGLPDPFDPVMFAGQAHQRVAFLVDGNGETLEATIEQFTAALSIHRSDESHNAQLIPVKLFWDRYPGRESVEDLMGGKPTRPAGTLKKIYQVVFKGRENLIRFSRPVSLKDMAQRQGSDKRIGHKLARVARIHFSRMQMIATGPKLPNRRHMFEQLLASSTIRNAIEDEANAKKISKAEATQSALKYLEEVAADFSYRNLRMADSVLSWVWNKIYSGIEVNHAEKVRQLAQEGHEIVYAPCHRSHMDYLLLSYVLYHQGMVPPHIAAGVNLNFWPAGPFFRRAGAFFIRRSFKGNKLYSTVFREYLGLLFSRGYSVEYFTEGGRSRTGRLLPPKTGMLAMTVQAMMRGLERPVTIVPVYFGYEHVMEVGTYYKELKGKTKDKESLLSLFGMLRKLRNFGHGYVNFGEPINLNHSLNKLAPEWRDHPEDGLKPSWLVPAVNDISNQLMENINSAAAVNGLCLSAIILLAAENRAMPRKQLVKQLTLCTTLIKNVPYSSHVTLPDIDAESLLDQAISLDKFEIRSDYLGEIVGLDEKQQVLLNFYRNNIIHLLIIPAFIATALLQHRRLGRSQLVTLMEQLYPLLKGELFMHYQASDMSELIERYLAEFVSLKLISESDDCFKIDNHRRGRLLLLAQIAQESLHRYAIVAALLAKCPHLERTELEQQALAGAQRLAKLHNIDAPEYYDKRITTNLLALAREQGYTAPEHANNLFAQLSPLLADGVYDSISELLDLEA
ncbi:glycerol-3-phosphate 1-O-acyltransferase PlsB [Agarivorans sp. MS3-6]|uniref:glycerol-3-phosphate 1-O-acyltransferase PlsB n=1 Tax=Agarivorans sp. TSD2052 TaxID=2937286 RepID=UPI00200CA390|nr:glycerol-3-phosphate 1-O-acyltransferase PlsB [Agarivorans sp. TSD2052]UPW18219.1 glycerol-3-phosphate 1-O-acyltransferase PlsB [Agarivorans sp. TSD2052]